MKYYKYIDLDNFDLIKNKSIDFIKPIDKIPYGLSFINHNLLLSNCPELATSLIKLGFEIKAIALYTTYINGPIHIDYKTDRMNKCRINIPLINCEGSITEFFAKGEYDSTLQKNGLEYFRQKENDTTAMKVAEVTVSKPTILNIQEPHRVVNKQNGQVPRICMSVFTDKDPYFLLEE